MGFFPTLYKISMFLYFITFPELDLLTTFAHISWQMCGGKITPQPLLRINKRKCQ